MKINKKLIVPFLSSVVGLSIAGGLGGAFAWYQFNSRVRTSLVGTSTADAGVLQIGHKVGENIEWGRDYSLSGKKLVPVTFGALNSDKTLKANAYGYPEAGEQLDEDYTQGWTVMEDSTTHEKIGYYQYDIYIRALKEKPGQAADTTNNVPAGYTLAEKDVYLSSMTISDLTNTSDDSLIADAVRVHLNVSGENGAKHLISKTAITATAPLNLYGKLDLDGDGADDKYFVPVSDSRHDTEIVYGVSGEKQITEGIDDVVDPSVVLLKTSTSVVTMQKITVTVWLEGWAFLKTSSAANAAKSNLWNPAMNAGMNVLVDMVFDVGNTLIGA